MADGGFRRFVGAVQSGIQSGISSIQNQAKSGSSTFYPTTLSAQKSLKCGWLRKQGGVVKSWHRRWFTLKGDNLYYFSTEDESKTPLGSIFLPGNKVKELPYDVQEPEKFLFEVQPGGDRNQMSSTHDTYPMCATSDDERKDWVKAIRKVIYSGKGGAIFGQSLEETMRFELSRSNRKVPKIVEQCVEFLKANGLEIEGLFRLPGRSTVVRDLREAYDCGEEVQFDLCETDMHSVASLLKGYLRELPEPIIPVQFYDSVRKVVMRDVTESPDRAYERLHRLLTNIPQHNYNLLQYLCRFLREVDQHNNINKMTAMNLALVFNQSIIRPEEEDPAILMGTANARTQIVNVLISQCDLVFRMEYTLEGSSVMVDTLLNFADGEGENHNMPKASHSSSLQSDLLGLDLTCQCTSQYESTSVSLNGSLEASVAGRIRTTPDLLMDAPVLAEDTKSTDSVIDPPYYTVADDNDISPRISDSDPLYNSIRQSAGTESSLTDDRDSVEDQDAPYAMVNMDLKRSRQRSLKHRSERANPDVPVKNIDPAIPLRGAPTPPPRPSKLLIQGSVSSIESLESVPSPDSAESDDQALEALINMDLSSFEKEDLLAHIQTLCLELNNQRSKVKDLSSQQCNLKRRQTDRVNKMAQKLDQEKTATAEAVERIMLLQGQLQQYMMKYGPLE